MRLGHELAGPAGAPVLVLSHSVGLNRAAWDGQMAVFTERFRVLRYDHRGHGESDVPPGPYTVADLAHDLLELLDELGVHRFTFCGLSLGGAVGMWLGSRVPERVERLVLCCTSARFEPHDLWAERAGAVRDGRLAELAPAIAAKWFTPRFREQRPDVVDRFRALLESVPQEGYASGCEALGAWDFRAELGTVDVPTLVIAAEDDVNTPPADGAAIADGIPGARLVVIPDAAHLVNVEQPEAFADAVLSHLEAITTTRVSNSLLQGSRGDGAFEEGMRTRREVLGDEHVDRAVEGTTELTADFQDLITRYAWGEIWTRPGLDRRMRSVATLTALIALGREEELAMHVRAARRNGLSYEEIAEVFLHAAVYCGVPAANGAFAVLKRVAAQDPP